MLRLLPLLLLTACATVAPPRSTAPVAPFSVKVVGHGPPMVLIPGLSSPGEVWDEVVAHYQEKYTCHVLTLAGFAGQPAVSEPLLPAAHDGLVRYLREQHLEKPVLVGHSLGGFLALWVASNEPDLVGRLVIVDSAPSFAALQSPGISATEAAMQADQFRTQLRMATPDQRARASRAIAKAMTSSEAQAQRVAQWSQRSDPDTVADAAYYLMTHDLRDEAAKVRAPALVIATWQGSRQFASRQEIQDRFTAQYQKCSTCQVVLNDKARHFVMLDDPSGLLAQLDAFLPSSSLVRAP